MIACGTSFGRGSEEQKKDKIGCTAELRRDHTSIIHGPISIASDDHWNKNSRSSKEL